MRINYNESAVLANSCLNRTDNKLSSSIEKLSSGLKINHAKDNPAGLAIANRMDAQIRGIGVASDNTNDGISVVETADGALSEIHAIIQRMSQLAVQAGDEVRTDDDRALINEEIKQLKQEIERIAKDTEFNGQALLDGSFDLKGYTDNINVKVATYSDEARIGEYKIDFAGLLSVASTDPISYKVDISKFTEANGFPQDDLKAEFSQDGILKVTAYGNFELALDFDFANNGIDLSDPGAVAGFVNGQGETSLELTGIGAMKIQIGANEGQELGVRIPEVSLRKMGIATLDVSTFASAQAGIEQIKSALNYINSERSRLGAYQNRMEHNSNNLDVSEENMTSSYSRIMDVDMAEEMTNYSTQQVLSQAGVAMLSQANERAQLVLQLLQ